jgi:hypothetical protein
MEENLWQNEESRNGTNMAIGGGGFGLTVSIRMCFSSIYSGRNRIC